MMLQNLKKNEIKKIVNNKEIRLGVVSKFFELFFIIYFNDYIENLLGTFHKEMMKLSIDDKINFLCIQSFRGSGKTTILTQAFPIRSILTNNKKFVLIISKSAQISKQFLDNIKIELESNEILNNDFDLSNKTIIYSKNQININDSIIKIANINTSLRGLKKGKHRPDLIICDDIEDIKSVKTKNIRDELYLWFKKEVIPLGGDNSKIILLGNYLSNKSLLNRIISEIINNRLKGVYRKYPIINNTGEILWNSKYNLDDIKKLKLSIGDNKTWYNEYLLMGEPNLDYNLSEDNFSTFNKEIPLNFKGKKISGIYIDYNSGLDNIKNTLILKLAILGEGDNAKYYIYRDYSYDKMSKSEVINMYDKLKINLKTKRKWIYVKNKLPKDLKNGLEKDFQSGILIKKQLYNINENKNSTYDEKFQFLNNLIDEKRILFQDGLDNIISEIINYGSDGEISTFMVQFLDFINYMINLNDNFIITSLPKSPYIFDPISEQEYFYDREREDFYGKEWKGRIVDEDYIIESYRTYTDIM